MKYLNKDIIKEGNPILRNISQKVAYPLNQDDLECLKGLYEYVVISSMDDLVQEYGIRPGVGIAAPQVGVNKRMFAINCVDFLNEKQPRYLWAVINPVITSRSKEMVYLPNGEGCLSVDRDTEKMVTPRHYSITAKADLYQFDTNKIRHVTLKLSGYPAIVFQHEYDHLDGILFTDKLYRESEVDASALYTVEDEENN